jgi:allantoin racemase
LRLLLINPNTSIHITRRLTASARGALEPGDELTPLTAQSGPAAVRTAEQLQEADRNAMAMAAGHASGHDAIVLAISLDGAAPRLRRQLPQVPVVGMTEAALLTACLRVDRVGLLTLGSALLPMYRRRVAEVGLASRIAGYEAAEAESAFADDGEPGSLALLPVLESGCARLAAAGAESVILAGAVLCGYARALTSQCGMPVFDGVDCAVRQARVLSAGAAGGLPRQNRAHR